MKINEIESLDNVYVKIGKTSITIKNSNTNKTKGVVKNIATFNTLSSRRKFSLKILKQLMKSNFKMDNVIIDIKDAIYYVINKKQYDENIKTIKRFKNKQGYDVSDCIQENNRIDEQIQFCNNNNIQVLKVNLNK